MIRPQHWIVALVIALALHPGVFAYVNFNAPVATAAAEGALGVEIDLGMLGDLGEAEETEQQSTRGYTNLYSVPTTR